MEERNRLAVLWTSPDREVALKMVFMYTLNSKLNGWWDQVEVVACKACSDAYGVSEQLAALGAVVKFMGLPQQLARVAISIKRFLLVKNRPVPLIQMLQSGWTQLTV